MKNVLLIIFLLVICQLPANVRAEKLVLTTLDYFAPYQYKDAAGNLTGIDLDIIREIARRLDIEVEFQAVPWKRSLVSVEKGLVDGLVGALKNPEREEYMFFTSEPIHIQKNVIMAPKDSGLSVSSLDDLKGRKIGVIRDFSYGPEFDTRKEGMVIKEGNDMDQLLVLFERKAVDGVATSQRPFMYFCKQKGTGNEFEPVFTIREIPAYMGFSKKRGEKSAAWAKKFSQGLADLKKEGLLEKLSEKYIK